MALQAIQAQLVTPRLRPACLYLHLANGWLEEEFLRAAEESRRRPSCPPGRPAGERITGPAPDS